MVPNISSYPDHEVVLSVPSQQLPKKMTDTISYEINSLSTESEMSCIFPSQN